MKFLILFSLFILVGCGGWEQRDCYLYGEDCPEKETTIVKEGTPGRPGESIVGPVGPAGKSTVGPKGESCTVQDTDQGAVISCEDGTSAEVVDGKDGESIVGPPGQDGTDAPTTGWEIVEILNPCGEEGTYDEILIRFANGELMAHYSNDNKQFTTLLSPGNFVTTDGTDCHFIVTEEMEVVW